MKVSERAFSKDEEGFTLIEVLVSLVIFSVAILGLIQAGSQSVAVLNQLENKTHASIVADNQLALARLQNPNVFSRAQSGQSQSGGRDFEYRIERTETPVPQFFELIITVSAQQTEQVLIERRAFVSVKQGNGQNVPR